MTIAYYLKDAPPNPPAAATPQGGRGGRGGRGGFGGAPCLADGGDGSRPYVTIADASEKVVCTLVPASHAGINQVLWYLNTYPREAALPGEYTFTLNAGGKTYVQKARLISRSSANER